MTTGEGFEVPEDLAAEYLRIRNESIAESKRYYFEVLMPLMKPALENRPEHIELKKARYKTLVSLMGFSPETTVHTCLILRPERLIIAHSDNEPTRKAAEPALNYLIREGIIGNFDLTLVPIDAFDPQDIYDRLRKHIQESENVVFDITGGTKVMSATAGALAWELNVTLCYLDGGWNPNSGSSGLQRVGRLTVKANPSRSIGYQRRKEALDSFARGNYALANERFETSRRLITDEFFDSLALALCRCYVALVEFDADGLSSRLEGLRETLGMGGVQRLLVGQDDFSAHVNALRRFVEKDPEVLTATFCELAQIYARQARYDLACLLWHRAMEQLVELEFQRLLPDFNMKKPDWQLFGPLLNLPEASGEVIEARLMQKLTELNPKSKKDGRSEELPIKVTLVAGFAILCVVEDFGERFPGQRNVQAFMDLWGRAEIRNGSYLIHGRACLSESEHIKLRTAVDEFSHAVFQDEYSRFSNLRADLRPRDIERLLR